MITANVIQRVFELRYKNQTGTFFIIDYLNRQYLITAQHVIEGIKDKENIEIRHNKSWVQVPIDLIGHGAPDVDISVFSINTRICPNYSLPFDNLNYIYGQDVYFLGFPYGYEGDIGFANNNNPLPFVKKAIISCFSPADKFLFLDGYNNPGFSGGPVVYKEAGKEEFNVLGVISAYQGKEEKAFLNKKDVGFTFINNTGIIIVYKIGLAKEIIEKNPNGYLIPIP
jgi:hypothetical protein